MKKGIAMTSLIIYVASFLVLIVVGTSITSNLTYKFIKDKEEVSIEEKYMKIYINILDSAKNSYSFNILNEDKVVFSNGDSYEYDDGVLYKNDNILDYDISEFEIIEVVSKLGNTKDKEKLLGIEVSFLKTDSNVEIVKDIYVTVGDKDE